MGYLRKNMTFVEKKTEISTELTRSTLHALVTFIEMYCMENISVRIPAKPDKDMNELIDSEIIKNIQIGLSWSERVLSPMGLDQDE
ncbi:hypothetical protein DV872_24050 [Oceanispirochaeta sp. M1]|nr:hypothetical protein DV872_24050 [Oceanispirochaeta sp. M1]